MSQINVEKILEFKMPRWSDFPTIEIYLDQLVTYLDQNLKPYSVGNPTIITKTMINNYVKQQVIPPPIKKKYSREHIASLFVICILKQVYSINNIADLITFAIGKANIERAYNNFCDELESAVQAVFSAAPYTIDKSISPENRLMKSLVLSFANKLYIETNFEFKSVEKDKD